MSADILPTELYDRLSEQPDQPAARVVLLAHLQEQRVRLRAADAEQRREIAYRLAGLLSHEVVRSLPEDDPLVSVLAMAGQLELPPAHRDRSASWERLDQLIDDLPTRMQH